MTPEDLERVYEALADQLDAVETGGANRELYLAKLVLLLAHETADADRVLAHVAAAAANLDA